MLDFVNRASGVLLLLLVAITTVVHAESQQRNPLLRIGFVRDAVIQNPKHRVSSVSSFNLDFDLENRQIRLNLEPNHDIIPDDAQVTYLGDDGTIERTETLVRSDHKVFKGTAKVKQPSGDWMEVGWARVSVLKDGTDPLFQGAFSIQGNSHHILTNSHYANTRHPFDPDVELKDEDYMVIFRDSDIADELQRTELLRKRGVRKALDPEPLSCSSNKLVFNSNPKHPVHQAFTAGASNNFWAGASLNNLFGRALDGSPGSGNSAGVNLAAHIGSTAGCPTTRKVALVGVATDCTYTSSFSSEQDMRKAIIDAMNAASRVYEQTFSISLALRNLTVSKGICPGEPQSTTPWNVPCSTDTDIQDRLNLFSQWRGSQDDGNSHWTLLTDCKSGPAVGLSWLGQVCKAGADTPTDGSPQETIAGANVVAKTSTEWQVIAHETGHTFGAVHDCTETTCTDGHTVDAQQCCPLSTSTCDAGEQFIMNPSTAEGIHDFSPCTIGNICTAIGRHSVKTSCLRDNVGITTITGQVCGNGIVEGDEDCDCGGEEGCGENDCCDAKSCTFKAGAVCDDSNEDCCNNCQLASADTVCRPSSGQCDPEEKCTGQTSTCPNDKTRPDGEDCGDGLQCASGQCTSRDQQCKTLMGSYTQGNDTYACDSMTCQISCASPEFGTGVCYGLQQNFLDGTDCGGGGSCQSGQCSGSSFGGEVSSWINDHKPIVIGVASAIGGLLLIAILGCIWRRCRRRRARKRAPPPPRSHRSGHSSRSGGSRRHRGQAPPMQQPWPPQTGSYAPGMDSTSQLWPQQGYGGQPGHNVPPPNPSFQTSRSVRYA